MQFYEKLSKLRKANNLSQEQLAEKLNVTRQKKNYLSDFLDYVTKTYNMFIHMSFKSKIVLLLEMCFIALVLLGIGALFYVGITVLIDLFVSILPSVIGYPLRRILEAISMGLLLVLGVIVFLHLFKMSQLPITT